MDKTRIVDFLAKIDRELKNPAELLIYGSAAFILLGEESRTSLDIDVAGPYSRLDYHEFCLAAQAAGLEVNPEESTQNDHIEWILGARLCLVPPDQVSTVILWQGRHLTVKTVPEADLVASKLIRYDAIDQSDVRYLVSQMKIPLEAIEKAVERLPNLFRTDIMVTENLKNLKQDMRLWKADQ